MSILTSVKKVLGITEEYTNFDTDLIMHINSVFFILNQLGIGKENFSIDDESAVWEDFLTDDSKLQLVKTYVYLKTRLLFDPPQSSAVTECIKTQIMECEWRLNVYAENSK